MRCVCQCLLNEYTIITTSLWDETRVAPDIISGPAEIRPNFHIRRPYPARIWHVITEHRARLNSKNVEKLIFLKYNASLMSWLKLITMFCVLQFCHYWVLTNDYWFINLTVYREILITMVLLFALVCFIAGYSYVMWCSQGLQLKNIRLQPRPRPNLQSQIRPNPAPAGFKKIKSGATLDETLQVILL